MSRATANNATQIAEWTAAISAIEREAKESFATLSPETLNWRPNEHAWSVGQCLGHLVKANAPYFPIFEGVKNGTKPSRFRERIPIVSAIWGALLLKSVHPGAKRKIKAPKLFQPSTAEISPETVNEFCDQQQQLSAVLGVMQNIDMDRTIITSPAVPFITYSVRDAFAILIAHEQRHMKQARNVLRLSDK